MGLGLLVKIKVQPGENGFSCFFFDLFGVLCGLCFYVGFNGFYSDFLGFIGKYDGLPVYPSDDLT